MGLRNMVDPTAKYQTPPQRPVPQWEYATVQLADWSAAVLDNALQTMGHFGWELTERLDQGVGPRGAVASFTLIFKRAR